MDLHKVVWERFDVNSYILTYDNYAVIIDCNKNTLPFLQKNNIEPLYIFLTHEHFDHIEGIGQIKKVFPQVTTIATYESSKHFSDDTNNMSRFFEGDNVVEPKADIEINSNQTFHICNQDFICYLTPGHTLGCMIIQAGNYLFTGDTVLHNIKTPKQGINSSKEELIKSLLFIKNTFDDNIIIYPGHGEKLLKLDWKMELSLGKI